MFFPSWTGMDVGKPKPCLIVRCQPVGKRYQNWKNNDTALENWDTCDDHVHLCWNPVSSYAIHYGHRDPLVMMVVGLAWLRWLVRHSLTTASKVPSEALCADLGWHGWDSGIRRGSRPWNKKPWFWAKKNASMSRRCSSIVPKICPSRLTVPSASICYVNN